MSRATRAIAALSLSLTVGSAALLVQPVSAAAHAPAAPSVTYTVKPGDYLTGIAAKLKVRLADLLSVNRLTVTSLIYPGMQLQVPAGGVLPASTPAAPAPTGQSIYTVKAGDYLSGIAAKMGVSLSALLTANKLTASSSIYPGTKLVVPSGGSLPSNAAPAAAPAAPLVYVVRSGDYLTGIAPKLGVKVSDLLAVNKLTMSSMIYPGMKLQVPAGGKLPAATPTATPASGSGSTSGTSTNARITKVLNFAQAQLGEPYKFNAAGPDLWDCSGLTMAAYAEAGISLPHYSGAQVAYGSPVNWRNEAIKPGDLIFLESYVGSGIINHVGIAISSTQWIQAPRTGDVVRVGNIPSVRVIAVRRIIQGG